MKPALLARKPRYPRQWSELPAGEDVRQIIEQALHDVSRHMFGFHRLHVGDLSAQIKLDACPIKHTLNITDTQHEYTNALGVSNELPLQKRSVDAAILAFELDFAQDPHQVLREVERVLMPNGYLVISAFNPLSLAGLVKYLPINQQLILHEARFFSSLRIRDWLHLLGFEVIEHHPLLFSELFFERKVNPNGRWQLWCRRYLPAVASAYLLVARKRVRPLSLIKPKWRAKPNFSTVSASMRQGLR